MRRAQRSILRRFKNELNEEDFCYVLDDTSKIKHGKNGYRVGKWATSSKNFYHGQKILVLVLIHKKKNIAIPIGFRFNTKKDDPEYESNLDQAIDLLKEALDAGFPPLIVVMDSWFDSTKFLEQIETLGLKFCVHAKSNRNIKANPGPNIPWIKWPKLFASYKTHSIVDKGGKQKKKKHAALCQVALKDKKKRVNAVAVYNRKNEKKPFAVYLTNDHNLNAQEVWELSRRRWHIEEMFRTLKQDLSFGKLSCSGKAGADLSICIPFILLIALHTNLTDLNPDEDFTRVTVGTRIEKIRAKSFEKTLSIMLGNPVHPNVQLLKNRRAISQINKKPVNRPAEYIKIGNRMVA